MATLAFGSFAMANTVDVETVEAVSVENVDNVMSENLSNESKSNQITFFDCFAIANASAASIGQLLDLTYFQEYQVFLIIYDNYMNSRK